MNKYFKAHIVALVLAVITGLIYVAPNLIYISSNEYKGLPFMSTDAESWYLSRINGVYKGCILNCNPYIKEYNYNYPFADSSISETILALPGIVFRIPSIYLKIFYEFLLPTILFLLSYLLIFRLTTNKYLAAVGSLFIVLGSNLVNATDLINLPELWQLFQGKTIYNQFLPFSRPVNPQFSSVCFLIYLNLLLFALTRKTKGWFFALGIFYGISFYIYFFFYAFITVVQGVSIGILLITKKYKDSLWLTCATILGFIIAVPQIVMILRLFGEPNYSTMPTYYLIQTHVPHITLVGVILFLAFVIIGSVYYKRVGSFSDQACYVGILIISCFITRNEHVVSGLIMQYDHFEKYMFGPIVIIFICFIASLIIKESSKKVILVMILIGCIPIYNSILIQTYSYRSNIVKQNILQQFVGVLNWIKDNSSDKAVFYAPVPLSNIITVYTSRYVLWASYTNIWIHEPERPLDFAYAETSKSAMEEIGKKYGVDYYVFENSKDFFKNSNKKIVYSDNYFTVYLPNHSLIDNK